MTDDILELMENRRNNKNNKTLYEEINEERRKKELYWKRTSKANKGG